jgi:hypothetical protein
MAVRKPDTNKRTQDKGQQSNALSRAAEMLGKLGGKKGGPARAQALDRKERSAIARMGANATNAKKGKKNAMLKSKERLREG